MSLALEIDKRRFGACQPIVKVFHVGVKGSPCRQRLVDAAAWSTCKSKKMMIHGKRNKTTANLRLSLSKSAIEQSPLFSQLVKNALDLLLLLDIISGFDSIVLFPIVSVDVTFQRVQG